jgi:hypothetical protein
LDQQKGIKNTNLVTHTTICGADYLTSSQLVRFAKMLALEMTGPLVKKPFQRHYKFVHFEKMLALVKTGKQA